MCLAIPMQIREISALKDRALATVDNQERPVDILLLDEVKIGDWVLVLSQQAVKIIDEKEAIEIKKIIESVLNGQSFETTEPQLPKHLQER